MLGLNVPSFLDLLTDVLRGRKDLQASRFCKRNVAGRSAQWWQEHAIWSR